VPANAIVKDIHSHLAASSSRYDDLLNFYRDNIVEVGALDALVRRCG
jgi:hypothetical protein